MHRGDHNSILPSRVRLRSAAAVQLHTAAVREGESIPREYDHPWVAYRTLARLTRKGRLLCEREGLFLENMTTL